MGSGDWQSDEMTLSNIPRNDRRAVCRTSEHRSCATSSNTGISRCRSTSTPTALGLLNVKAGGSLKFLLLTSFLLCCIIVDSRWHEAIGLQVFANGYGERGVEMGAGLGVSAGGDRPWLWWTVDLRRIWNMGDGVSMLHMMMPIGKSASHRRGGASGEAIGNCGSHGC